MRRRPQVGGPSSSANFLAEPLGPSGPCFRTFLLELISYRQTFPTRQTHFATLYLDSRVIAP